MSIDGSWNIVVKSPMGDQKSTLNVKSQGSAITGTLSGPGGPSEIENGTIEGDKVSWVAKITVPFPITLEFAGVVDGGSLSGSVKAGALGTAQFSGVRT